MKRTSIPAEETSSASESSSRSITGPSRYAPPDAFWQDFVNNFWEQRATTFAHPIAQPLMTEGEALAIFRGLAEKFRTGQQADVDFYIESGMLRSGIGQLLPGAAERELDAYRNRVMRETGGRPFSLITNSVRSESPRHRQRVRAFTRGLLELVGRNAGTVGADIFLSNTLRTPFGIHRDAGSNFSFIVSGRKRMLVWPYEVFASRIDQRCSGPNQNVFLDGLDYEAYRACAIVLEGGAGDVLYWPSSYWHVAEAVTDQASLVFNIPIYLHAAFSRMALEYYQRNLDRLNRNL